MKDRVIALLEKAMIGGSGNRTWILQDPDYNSLRKDPRFIALMEGAAKE